MALAGESAEEYAACSPHPNLTIRSNPREHMMCTMRFRPFLCTLGTIVSIAFMPAASMGQDRTPNTPEELLDAWVELWTSFDLDVVSDLFLQDERLTYFSSEREGLLTGFPRIVEHYRGFGFEPGGGETERVIWVGDVEVANFGDAALMGAIWYFGDPQSPEGVQYGPMSVLAVRSPDGYRIAHMHFATYFTPGS